jgi:hypothetical protein
MKIYTISIIDNDCKFSQNKMLMMRVNGLNSESIMVL